MPKNMHVNKIDQASSHSTSSVGTRGESATARNQSGNHHGNRVKSNRKPKSQGRH